MKSFLRRKEAESSIDITPLMDIVFQLLLFFILTSAFLQPSLELEIPGSSQEREGAEADAVISVDAEGRIFLNGTPLLLPELEDHIRSLAEENPQAAVVFQGDRQASYGSFFAVLDAVRNTGIKTINLAHEILEN